MHLGFRKQLDARRQIRIIESEDLFVPPRLRYRPPLIFSAKYGQPLHETNSSSFHGIESGAFEVKATGDGVKAYAFLWVYDDLALSGIERLHHRQICQVLKKLLHIRREFGRVVLGGGYMMADYDQRVLHVFGQSGDYGRVPDFMQLSMFKCAGFKVHVAGYGNVTALPGSANLAPATDWYLSHGIEIGA